MQSISNVAVFDGKDPRFPDLSRYPHQAETFSRAVGLAHQHHFGLAGIEHLMHELLAESGFRGLIESAGGDADVCRGSLSRAFRDHASFMDHASFKTQATSPQVALSGGMHSLIEAMGDIFGGGASQDPTVRLAEFYLKVIAHVRGSMIAECALQDCGAGSLLLDTEDVSFFESDFEYMSSRGKKDDMVDSMFDDSGLLGDGWPADNPPAAAMVNQSASSAPKGESNSGTSRSTPASSRRSGRSEADVAKKVDDCLRDIGAKAARGAIDPVVGRDREINEVLSALRRRRKSSVILYGEAGVGKTAIAEGLALRLRSSSIDRGLAERPFYELSLQDMVAGTKYRGEFEERMSVLIARLRDEKAILFVDEFHMIVGAGSTYGREMDGANMLKTALGRGEITIIGATTPSEMRELRQDAALMRRFQTLHIREPSREETLEILGGSAWSYLAHHEVEDTPDVLEEICRITDLYQPERRFPDKAFDLLDAACVTAVETTVLRPVDAPVLLTKEHVRMAADKMGLRRPQLPPAEKMKAFRELEATLGDVIDGQDRAIGQIGAEARAAALNIDTRGPAGSMLLSGPDGTEPARITEAFADALAMPYRRIDLGQMRDPGSLYRLVGLSGASGPDRTGRLVEIGDSHHEVVLLLDNVDQADISIRELVTDILKTGVFRAADGRMISLRGAWIMLACTSDQEADSQPLGFGRDREEHADLRSRLDPEMLAEVRRIVRLERPCRDGGLKLVKAEVETLCAQFLEMGIALTVDDEAMDHIAGLENAQAIREKVRVHLRDLATAAVWENPAGQGVRISLDPENELHAK